MYKECPDCGKRVRLKYFGKTTGFAVVECYRGICTGCDKWIEGHKLSIPK